MLSLSYPVNLSGNQPTNDKKTKIKLKLSSDHECLFDINSLRVAAYEYQNTNQRFYITNFETISNTEYFLLGEILQIKRDPEGCLKANIHFNLDKEIKRHKIFFRSYQFSVVVFGGDYEPGGIVRAYGHFDVDFNERLESQYLDGKEGTQPIDDAKTTSSPIQAYSPSFAEIVKSFDLETFSIVDSGRFIVLPKKKNDVKYFIQNTRCQPVFDSEIRHNPSLSQCFGYIFEDNEVALPRHGSNS